MSQRLARRRGCALCVRALEVLLDRQPLHIGACRPFDVESPRGETHMGTGRHASREDGPVVWVTGWLQLSFRSPDIAERTSP